MLAGNGSAIKVSFPGGVVNMAVNDALFENEEWWDAGGRAVKEEGYKRRSDYYYFRLLLKALFVEPENADKLNEVLSSKRERLIYDRVGVDEHKKGESGWITGPDAGQLVSGRSVQYMSSNDSLTDGVVIARVTNKGNLDIGQHIIANDGNLADKYVALEIIDRTPIRVFDGLEDGDGQLRLVKTFRLREVDIYQDADMIEDTRSGEWLRTDGIGLKVVKSFAGHHADSIQNGVICTRLTGEGYLCLIGQAHNIGDAFKNSSVALR